MALYATLADFRAENKAVNTADNNIALSSLRIVSRRIDSLLDPLRKRRVFEPIIEARKVRVTSDRVNSHDNTLRLDSSLLVLTTTVLGTTTLTDAEGWPDSTAPPFPYLRRTTLGVSWYTDCGSCGSPLFATLTGVWGIHRDYANAWMAVDVIATANINASVTTLTVADVDGADAYGLTPRISAGNLLKIGDEYLEVTATNTTTNAVTVRRGVNGSTAAAHVIGDTVSVWQVEEPIRRVVARQAALIYARRGAYEVVGANDLGTEIRYPQDLLTELRATLQDYAYGN